MTEAELAAVRRRAATDKIVAGAVRRFGPAVVADFRQLMADRLALLEAVAQRDSLLHDFMLDGSAVAEAARAGVVAAVKAWLTTQKRGDASLLDFVDSLAVAEQAPPDAARARADALEAAFGEFRGVMNRWEATRRNSNDLVKAAARLFGEL